MSAGRASSRSLANVVLLAEGAVILAMAATVAVAALLVGPPLFQEHMRQAGHDDTSAVARHAELAFRSAGMISVGVGIVIAVLGASLMSLVITRRLKSSLNAVTEAARQVSRGTYDVRIPDPGLGAELSTLTEAFNRMASRLEATEGTRQRLLTDLAHEIRTPLAAIDVCLEGLEDGILPADATTYRMLRAQTRRLNRLTDDIRAVSAAEEGRLALELSRVAVKDVVDQALAAAREAYQRKRVALVAAPVDSGLLVTVDASRIGQLLANLLSNALRHTPGGGTVRLAVTAGREQVLISVTDDGDGIPADALDHVFERFYRVDTARNREHGGTGIGLTISASIAHAHGGSLQATSAGLGRGSTFTLRLAKR